MTCGLPVRACVQNPAPPSNKFCCMQPSMPGSTLINTDTSVCGGGGIDSHVIDASCQPLLSPACETDLWCLHACFDSKPGRLQ